MLKWFHGKRPRRDRDWVLAIATGGPKCLVEPTCPEKYPCPIHRRAPVEPSTTSPASTDEH